MAIPEWVITSEAPLTLWPLGDALSMAAACAMLGALEEERDALRKAGEMLYAWVLDVGHGAAIMKDDREARRVALAAWAGCTQGP